MDGSSRSLAGDLMFGAGMLAWALFVFSGGVYAGATGRVRGVALVVAVVAAAVGSALVLASTRAGVRARR